MTSKARDTGIYPERPSLVYYGNTTLRTEADKITAFDNDLKALVDSMFEIMERNNGIGLAGPQVDISSQIIIMNLESYGLGKFSLANPQIVHRSQSSGPYNEGCLSIPGIYEEVIRPLEITVEALDITGKDVELKADGILARVLQHEIDHLHGVLFIDHLEQHIRKSYTKELKQIKKLNRG